MAILDNPATRTAWRLGLVAGLFLALAPFLPQVSFPEPVKNAFAYFFGVLFKFDFILPAEVMTTILFYVITFESIVVMLWIILFVYRLLTQKS